MESVMPQEPIAMVKTLELLQLKYEKNLSTRKIAANCNISHTTVREYLRRFEKAGLTWPLPVQMTEEELQQRLFPPAVWNTEEPIRYMPEMETLHKELSSNKHVTLQLLWEECRREHPNLYGRTQFYARYRAWERKQDVRCRLPHKAGEKLYVDYAGDKVPVYNPKTGAVDFEASLFVTALGVSQFIFAEAHRNQTMPNWIGGHVRAFAFYQGAPEVAVPDNLRTGVKSPCYYDPEIHPEYAECLRHYGVVAIPTRVRTPRDKSKAENAVLQAERWILARLRRRRFLSLAGLNTAIRELLEELNGREKVLEEKSRRVLWEEIDRPALHPLPDRPYEYAEWKDAVVHIDGHIQIGKNFYSVPPGMIHEKVRARITENTVEIHHRTRLDPIAIHPRLRRPGAFSTLPEHLPEGYRQHLEWTPERFLRWAESIGMATRKVIEEVLSSRAHPEQGYRCCLGILMLAREHSREALEEACARARLRGMTPRYGVLRLLAKECKSKSKSQPSLPEHANLRGRPYFS
jgi:transposase